MSIVPIFFRNWWDDELDRPLWNSRLLDQHFGRTLTADDLLNAFSSLAESHNRRLQQLNSSGCYVRPWHSSCVANKQDSGSTVNVTNDKFQINLDVQQFAPEEISIESSLSSDGILTITCPRLAIEQKPEKTIPITQTGEPSKTLGDQSKKEDKSQLATQANGKEEK
uniref:Uncharacterized protein n=1 Tax=Anopheles albimanus TaxID=7167 RepID=A0A182FEK4_ANOAL